MIHVNLIPRRISQKKKIFLPGFDKHQKVITLGIIVVAGLFIALTSYLILYPFYQKHILQSYTREWKKIQPEYNSLLTLKKKKSFLQERVAVIEGINNSRIIWAAVLNSLSNAVPLSIQLTYVGIEKDSLMSDEVYILVLKGKVAFHIGEKAIEDLMRGLKKEAAFNIYFPRIMPPATYTSNDGAKKQFVVKCLMSADYALREI